MCEKILLKRRTEFDTVRLVRGLKSNLLHEVVSIIFLFVSNLGESDTFIKVNRLKWFRFNRMRWFRGPV